MDTRIWCRPSLDENNSYTLYIVLCITTTTLPVCSTHVLIYSSVIIIYSICVYLSYIVYAIIVPKSPVIVLQTARNRALCTCVYHIIINCNVNYYRVFFFFFYWKIYDAINRRRPVNDIIIIYCIILFFVVENGSFCT